MQLQEPCQLQEAVFECLLLPQNLQRVPRSSAHSAASQRAGADRASVHMQSQCKASNRQPQQTEQKRQCHMSTRWCQVGKMAQSARATRDDDMSPRQLGVHCAVCTGIWLFSKLTQCEAGAAVLRERVMMTPGNSPDCSEVVERALRCGAWGVTAAEAHTCAQPI